MLEEKINCPCCGGPTTLNVYRLSSGFHADGTEFFYESLSYKCKDHDCQLHDESFTTTYSDTITMDNYNKGRRGYNRKNKINEYFR